MPGYAALIVAAGSGVRLGGGQPKQYLALAGVPILRRAIEAFLHGGDICHIQVVTGDNQQNDYEAAIRGLELLPPVQGGATRQASVRNGLEALAEHDPTGVLIHDAARPLVSASIIHDVLAALKAGAEAVVPLLPVSASLKRRESPTSLISVHRDGLYRAQTPQGFQYGPIRAAHRRFADTPVTDDIALAELAGLAVTGVKGEEANMKITTAADLAFAERWVSNEMEIRTGFGFDVHRFVAGDHVWLCGVQIPYARGLEGHSDADAGLHALTDALLGALSNGDIGQHFPPQDEKWRNAPSRLFLAHAAELVRKAAGRIVHCDVTLICEEPRIGPFREAMRATIAEVLAIPVARVSVKATTTEGLGFSGRGEGLAAQAVATIELPRL